MTKLGTMIMVGLLASSVAACKKDKDEPKGDEVTDKGTGTGAVPPKVSDPAGGFPQLQCDDKLTVRKDDQGRVVSCYLSAAVVVGKTSCAAGGVAQLFPDGAVQMCKLASELQVDSLTCRDEVELHASGKIRKCTFPAPGVELSGVKCGSSALFYETGTLENCSTAEPITVQGVSVPADTSVSLSQDGKLRSVGFASDKPYVFQKYRCADTHFHPNGSVAMCETSEKIKIKGETSPLNAYLCFDEAGKPAGQEIGAQCADWNAILQ